MNRTESQLMDIIDGAGDGLISVPELLGFQDKSADRLYNAALSFFERDAVAQAESVLEWLLSAKPYVARYWTAYAGTLQAREAFPSAIRAYTTALALDADDLVARAHRGECCLMVGLVERGLDDLRVVTHTANVTDELRHWVGHAKRLVSLHEEATAMTVS